MLKNRKTSKFLAVAAAMIMSLSCFSATAFATDSGDSTGTSTETGKNPERAISGSTTVSTSQMSGWATGNIYSPSNSWFGHATITVSGGEAVVQIIKPDGTGGYGTGGAHLAPGTHNCSMISCPAGNYEVRVQSAYGDLVTVTVTLGDWL